MMIGSFFSSGNEATISKPRSMIAHLKLAAHPHMAFDNLRPAFGVEGDVVDRRARLPGRVVLAADDMLQKVAQELRGLSPPGPGLVRTADADRRAARASPRRRE